MVTTSFLKNKSQTNKNSKFFFANCERQFFFRDFAPSKKMSEQSEKSYWKKYPCLLLDVIVQDETQYLHQFAIFHETNVWEWLQLHVSAFPKTYCFHWDPQFFLQNAIKYHDHSTTLRCILECSPHPTAWNLERPFLWRTYLNSSIKLMDIPELLTEVCNHIMSCTSLPQLPITLIVEYLIPEDYYISMDSSLARQDNHKGFFIGTKVQRQRRCVSFLTHSHETWREFLLANGEAFCTNPLYFHDYWIGFPLRDGVWNQKHATEWKKLIEIVGEDCQYYITYGVRRTKKAFPFINPMNPEHVQRLFVEWVEKYASKWLPPLFL